MPAQASSQAHGFAIEHLLIQEFERLAQMWNIPTMPSRDHVARFDVPSYKDPMGKGLPTSIKTTAYRGRSTLVCLSDAVRIVELGEEPRMRLMVALYEQKGPYKEFKELREYLVEDKEWRKAFGGVPIDVVEEFANAIKGKPADEARAEARAWKRFLASSYPKTLLRWNPKIDSKHQRRLQCSIRLKDLEAIIQDKSRIRVYGQPSDNLLERPSYLMPISRRLWGDGLALPFSLFSPPRQRRIKPPEPEAVAAPALPPTAPESQPDAWWDAVPAPSKFRPKSR